MANRRDDIKARLRATFQVEAEEHLQAITANLLALDRGLPPEQAREVLEATFRAVHTLKGAARSVSLLDVESLCQACESVLSRITRERLAPGRPLLDRLHEVVDGVARLIAGGEPAVAVSELAGRLAQAAAQPAAGATEAIEPPPPPPQAPVAPTAAGLPPADSIRLPTAKLDALLLHVEDLLVPKLAAAERVRQARGLAETLAGCRAALHRARTQRASGADGRGPGLLEGLESNFRALDAQARELLGALVRDQRTMAGAMDGLQEETRRLRMTPAATVLDLFPAMVRDLARMLGKEAELIAAGSDLEVDRKVLEAMKDPLIHLVRNAIDHGIERPEVRAQAGKSPQGRVEVTIAALEGGRIEIRVEDDGRGIDPAQVRAAAVRARLLSAEEAERLPDEAALDLIYRSGLSTSPIISEISGHGLGLAIVKDRVARLDGHIRVETRMGSGTTVRMILPATIATFHGLLVRAGTQLFLLPTEAVERVARVGPDAVQRVEGREAMRWDGSTVPVARLGDLLGLPEIEGPPPDPRAATPASPRPCAIVKVGEERAALLVEEVLGDREGLVKELAPPLVRVRNVADAALLGTGQVVLILRPADLLRSLRAAARPPAPVRTAEEQRRQPVILVVDDSITTRTMEKNLLEAASYQVRVAVDGIEAWTLLKSEEVGLVVSDVDMPRMNGFELTARIRADRELADLPVVLVTALESREDKERGIEVGANAYVVKSSFDRSNLLEIIRRLI